MSIKDFALILTIVIAVAFIVSVAIFELLPTLIFFGILATLGTIWGGLIFAFIWATKN